MPTPPPEELVDRSLLRRLAGEQSFARGEEYFTDGRVRQLRVASGRVSARVNGSRTYRVKLWRRRGALQFKCDCADGQTDAFCKHCVAVGLAWLSRPDEPGAVSAALGAETAKQRSGRREEERRQLIGHLRTFDRARLSALLLEATDFDEILRRRLLLEATGIAPGLGPRATGEPAARGEMTDAYRRLLREAVQPTGIVDYHGMQDYAQGLEEAIAPLAEWLERGWHDEVVSLVEFVLRELDAAAERVDIGDPLLNRLYEDLQKYHLGACRSSSLDPAQLASRLLDYELDGGLGIFNNALKTYAEVLGESGRAAWRSLLIREWGRLTSGGSTPARAEEPSPIDHRRFQAQMLMERLAAAEDNVEVMQALKLADLRGVRDHVAYAEWLAGLGRHDDALAAAERAAREFTGADEKPVWREFLIAAHRRSGNSAAALELTWAQFEQIGGVEAFRDLRGAVAAHDPLQWPSWRDRALASERGRTQDAQAGSIEATNLPRADASGLIELLLEENLDAEAWQAAVAGGCRTDLWFSLAGRRAGSHPARTIEVYTRAIDRALSSPGAPGTREAAELVLRLRALLVEQGHGADYERTLTGLRAKHGAKRSFLRLLAAAGI